MRHLELPLLQEAVQSPEDADLALLWQEVEGAIVDLDSASQLKLAGEAIAQITAVFEARSQLAFQELTATASDDGPPMPEDAFDRYVRQTMQIDFEVYLEPWSNLPRKPIERTESDTIVGLVEKETLMAVLEQLEVIDPIEAYTEAMSLAHEEDVSAWGSTIEQWFQQENQSEIGLLQLQQAISMPLVQLWLALLLNGFTVQQRGDFYQTEQVWVVLFHPGQES